jgi:drug/metabolite transporter (DMT)-like permease
MNPTALALVLVSAVLHATWNFLAKRARDQVAFVFLLMAGSLVAYAGPLVWGALRGHHFGPWYIWVASGLLQASYCYLMGRGYECGDLSQVYPLARGLAPGLIALLAWLIMGERLSPLGAGGIAAVIAASLVLHTDDCRGLVNGDSLRAMWRPGSRLAILASVMIAGYHLTDKYGALHATSPVDYLAAMQCFLVAFLGVMTWRLRTTQQVLSEWRGNWRLVLAGAVLSVVAYVLVVTAMKLAPVAYVAATRNVSILIGVCFGVAALKEQGLWWRVGGALMMLAGLAAVAFSS